MPALTASPTRLHPTALGPIVAASLLPPWSKALAQQAAIIDTQALYKDVQMKTSGLLVLAFVAACADVDCPPVSDSCPSGCATVSGSQVTPECGSFKTIACLEDMPSTMTADIACVVRIEDQHAFSISSGTLATHLSRTGEWRRCTAEDLQDSPTCGQ